MHFCLPKQIHRVPAARTLQQQHPSRNADAFVFRKAFRKEPRESLSKIFGKRRSHSMKYGTPFMKSLEALELFSVCYFILLSTLSSRTIYMLAVNSL